MRLHLVQHGEARPKDADPDRQLTEKGAAEVGKVAGHLKAVGVKADAVWHSGKARARQTAEILAKAIAPGAEAAQRDGLAPKDPVAPVAEQIAAAGGSVAVVGHMPFLGKLASLLLAGDEDADVIAFQYGGVVCLEGEGGAWRVAWMLVPALVP